MGDEIDTNAMALLAKLNQDALDKQRDYCGCHRKDDQKYGDDCINCRSKRLDRLEPLLRRMVGNQIAMAKAGAVLREENRTLRTWQRKAAPYLTDLQKAATDPVIGDLVQDIVHGGEWAARAGGRADG